MQQFSFLNNVSAALNNGLDKLERKIIRKLQRCKIDGVAGNSMTNHKQHLTKGKISASTEQEQGLRYFELGMYWYGREEGNHKDLTWDNSDIVDDALLDDLVLNALSYYPAASSASSISEVQQTCDENDALLANEIPSGKIYTSST